MTTSFKLAELPNYLLTIPKFMYFLLTCQPSVLDYFMITWDDFNVIKITDWVESEEFKWALLLDLSGIGIEDEVAILPFSWAERHDPTMFEAIYAWRVYAEDKKI